MSSREQKVIAVNEQYERILKVLEDHYHDPDLKNIYENLQLCKVGKKSCSYNFCPRCFEKKSWYLEKDIYKILSRIGLEKKRIEFLSGSNFIDLLASLDLEMKYFTLLPDRLIRIEDYNQKSLDHLREKFRKLKTNDVFYKGNIHLGIFNPYIHKVKNHHKKIHWYKSLKNHNPLFPDEDFIEPHLHFLVLGSSKSIENHDKKLRNNFNKPHQVKAINLYDRDFRESLENISVYGVEKNTSALEYKEKDSFGWFKTIKLKDLSLENQIHMIKALAIHNKNSLSLYRNNSEKIIEGFKKNIIV